MKSFINYQGGKYRLINQILPLFPKNFNNFIDIFCGSGVVATNHFLEDKYGTDEYLLNDINKPLIELIEYISECKIEEFIEAVEAIIKFYNLSDTYTYSYSYYNADSSKGLGSVNKESYLKLRNDFNHSVHSKNYYAMFYTLIVFGFNNQIRFNRKGEFNLPVGKRDFNKNMRNKLIDFAKVIQFDNFGFSSQDFRNINYNKNDFIYLDPPYSIATATYNENNGWSKEDDKDLFDYMDTIDSSGAMFALSNVLSHKGITNDELIKWSENYKIHFLNFDYNNSNYQSLAKDYKTVEVLITNF